MVRSTVYARSKRRDEALEEYLRYAIQETVVCAGKQTTREGMGEKGEVMRTWVLGSVDVHCAGECQKSN